MIAMTPITAPPAVAATMIQSTGSRATSTTSTGIVAGLIGAELDVGTTVVVTSGVRLGVGNGDGGG
jgi:hypothetical protein